MRKGMRLAAAALAAVMTVGVASTAMAGEWKKDSKGWWWQNDDGSYPTSSWQWLDGNKDGVAEYYYFDSTGYMLENTKTPDGNSVNADGAWVIDGVVQTQTTAVAATPVQNEQPAVGQTYTDDYSGTYVYNDFVMVLKYNKADNTIDANIGNYANCKYTYVGPTAYNGHILFALVSEEDKDAITFAGPGLLDWWSEVDGSDITIQRQ